MPHRPLHEGWDRVGPERRREAGRQLGTGDSVAVGVEGIVPLRVAFEHGLRPLSGVEVPAARTLGGGGDGQKRQDEQHTSRHGEADAHDTLRQ